MAGELVRELSILSFSSPILLEVNVLVLTFVFAPSPLCRQRHGNWPKPALSVRNSPRQRQGRR